MSGRKLAYTIASVAFISLLVYLPLYFFYVYQKKSETELYLTGKITQSELQLNALRSAYTLLSQNIYDNIINTDKITSIIKSADRTYDSKTAGLLRQQLYTELLPLYQNLKRQNISQLNFYLQGNINFLRFSDPEKYGDTLIGTRSSIEKVNRIQQPLHGFEEGSSINGFRHIFPLMYEKKFVGIVEIAYAFNALRQETLKTYPAYYAFILKKDLVDTKSDTNTSSIYSSTTLSPYYLQEMEPSKQKSSYKVNQELIEQINQNIAAEAAQRFDKGAPFLLHTELEKKQFTATFIPVSNIENKHVAYYVSYQQDRILSQINDIFGRQLLISACIVILFSTLLVLYFWSRQKATEALRLLETTDPLTKIANRNKFNLVLYSSMQMALRYELPLSILVFNIDRFKEINDRLGTDTGDDILIELTALVSHNIRLADLFARWDGDEFIILLPETTHHNADILAEKLRKIIREHTFVVTTNLTCSFGVTQLHKNDDEISILKRVNSALHSAKNHGRNRVVEFS